MSDLYNVRILSIKDATMPPASGTKGCESEFAQLLMRAFPEEEFDEKVNLTTFLEYMKKWVAKSSLSDIREAFAEYYFHSDSVADELESKEDLLYFAEAIGDANPFIGNNILAQFFPAEIPVINAKELEVELVTRHPDAGLPNEEFGLDSFFMTLLDEFADGEMLTQSDAPTWQFVDPKKNDPIRFEEESDQASPMLVFAWELETFALKFNEEFKAKHADAWWVDLIDYLEEPSDNLPYGYGRYKIMFVDPWFEDAKLNETFDSAAYHG